MNRPEVMPATRHAAWVEVDLTALVHNAGVLRRAIPAAGRLGLLVKANGYGHGLEMAARAGVRGGADQLVVANLDEGLTLRSSGIEAPLLVAYQVPPDGVVDAAEAGLELSVSGVGSTRWVLEAWASVAASLERPLSLHVEVDTGMGRGGVLPDSLPDVVRRIDATPGTTIAGIWSHLADGNDPERSRDQVERFEAALARLAATGRAIPPRHLVATEGLFRATAPAYEMVRIGLGFYGELGLGVEPAAALAALAADLRPAMEVKARAVRLERLPAGAPVGYGCEWTAARPSTIATLPIGYADGWVRTYWPGASALVHGRRVPLVGRVSMDSVCADVTDVGEVTEDDEFVLLGRQGDDRIGADDLARLRGSIPNEIFCSFGPRLPRIYLGEDGVVAVTHQADRVDRLPGTSW